MDLQEAKYSRKQFIIKYIIFPENKCFEIAKKLRVKFVFIDILLFGDNSIFDI